MLVTHEEQRHQHHHHANPFPAMSQIVVVVVGKEQRTALRTLCPLPGILSYRYDESALHLHSHKTATWHLPHAPKLLTAPHPRL